MTEKYDDLEAVRSVVEALKGFEPKDQERIIRWSRERLGLSVEKEDAPTSSMAVQSGTARRDTPQDIKTFVNSKNPKADTHFATTVAFYYKFVAPEAERKDFINGTDLQDACRQVGRERMKNPTNTLSNAHKTGYLDKGPDKGSYEINTVGENLVAMTLPASSG